ncbi:MAG: phosphatidate cytidylyltransferase [Pseudomonadota bacterium]|nr:phosphatidate cytidylyltransferase [Pseudomonadota bacterium]
MAQRLGRSDLVSMRAPLSNLQKRVLSALVIAPFILLVALAGGAAFFLIVALCAVLGFSEWLRLTNPKAGGDVVFFSFTALILTIAIGAWQTTTIGLIVGAVLVTAQYFLVVDGKKNETNWVTVGVPYLGGFALALFSLRGLPQGAGLVYYLLAVVWGTDIGAYLAGRTIGGPKLAPAISPGKTWAGVAGGIILAGVLGFLIAWLLGARHAWVGLVLAVPVSVASQAGDLFESWIKRQAGVKESGDLIPGHGGILDRIDGLIFAAIFFALFQCLIGEPLGWW